MIRKESFTSLSSSPEELNAAIDVTRRQLIARSAAAGATVAGLSALGVSSASAASPPFKPAISPVPAPPVAIFTDETLTFQCLFALGNISSGAGEYGEITTVIKAVQARGESYVAFYEEFTKMASKVHASGVAAQKRGDRVTARGAYLRSAAYYAQALYFVLAGSSPANLLAMAAGGKVPAGDRIRERNAYRRMRSSWELAGSLMRPAMQVVKLPWEGPNGPMPGWFLRPSGERKRRPTVLMNNGSDAQAIDLWSAGALASLQRGWNVLIFDGPGEGGMLFEKNQTFVPQWEKVIRPIVSWLRRRPDVDRDAIVLSGSSFGGELVPRAAAYESRLAAISMDPGVVDAASTWSDSLPAFWLAMFKEGKAAELNAQWAGFVAEGTSNDKFSHSKHFEIYPGGTFFEKLTAIVEYNNSKVLGRIRMPALVINNEIEQFFPGQAKQLYDGMTHSRRKKLVTFTVAQGAQFHCEPMAPQLRNSAVIDFFDSVIG